MSSDDCDVFFSSFIAGALYENRRIENINFGYLLSDFCNVNDVDVGDDDEKIDSIVELDDKSIYLTREYDDIIIINGQKMTLKEYLYSLTTPIVRKYFNIPEVENKINNSDKLIKKIKRTKTSA